MLVEFAELPEVEDEDEEAGENWGLWQLPKVDLEWSAAPAPALAVEDEETEGEVKEVSWKAATPSAVSTSLTRGLTSTLGCCCLRLAAEEDEEAEEAVEVEGGDLWVVATVGLLMPLSLLLQLRSLEPVRGCCCCCCCCCNAPALCSDPISPMSE